MVKAHLDARTIGELSKLPVMHVKERDPGADNNARASFAAVALVAYTSVAGGINEPLETIVSDLLGDLRHLCDGIGVNFDTALGEGEWHYTAEIAGED